MAEPTAEQEMQSRVNAINYKISSLQSSVRLADLRDAVEDMDTLVNGLRPCVQDLRERGYVFGKGFESKADAYQRQWRSVRPGVMLQIESQVPQLERELRPLEAQFSQVRARATGPGGQAALDRLDSQLETLSGRVSAVSSSINGMYDSIRSEVNTFKSRINRVGEMLQRFAQASFRLLPTEAAIMAVKAVYSRDAKMDKDDPQGYLFLTDQRLLFEQNQEIATKKVLFITTEKQKVQKLLFETPLALTEQVQASKKGLFGHQDHLEMRFKSGAPVYQAWFHLNGQDCNEWQALIGSACSGGLADERAVAVDTEAVRKTQAAPGKCPNCGAPVTQVVLRGMDSITCAYCQFVIRL